MIEFHVKMEAPSTPNLREHHMARAKRVKRQRGAIQRTMPKWVDGPLLVVRITRVAARLLDGDNVQGACKAVRDQIATGLRIDDATPLVRWEYEQAKGEAEVVVQIWRAGDNVPPMPEGSPVKRKGKTPATVSADAGKRKRMSVVREPGTGQKRAPKMPPGKWDKAKVDAFNSAPVDVRTRLPGQVRRAAPHYFPPRSTPVDAAKEAEATFAPILHIRREDGFCTCGAGPKERC